ILSALVGISFSKGEIANIDQKVLPFFPQHSFSNISPLKKDMTIQNLLTMTSGFDWQWKMDAALTGKMLDTADPIQFILDYPMQENTAAKFSYCTANSHVLSAIISKTSGMSTFDFAQKNLFGPLGIQRVDWSRDNAGINWGGFGLLMSPLDMARFGYLYLRNGVWDEKQIIPSDWVRESTRMAVSCSSFPYDTEGFGYQWWIEPFGYSARGLSGNYLFVLPAQDIVVVITGEQEYYTLHQTPFPRYASFDGELRDGPTKHYVSELIKMFLVDPASSTTTMSPNSKEHAAFMQYITAAGKPKPKPVRKLPSTAARITGRTISFTPNMMHIKSLCLSFRDNNICTLTQKTDDGGSSTYVVGLDDVYRRSQTEDSLEIAFKGEWKNSDTFEICQQELWEAERFFYRFKFSRDAVSVEITGSVSNLKNTISGTLLNK
ncbi:MAG TPA: serine hydrolase, partial [Spirochaetota bacterium]